MAPTAPLPTLAAIGDALGQALTPEDVTQAILTHATRALGAYAGAVARLVDAGRTFELVGTRGYPAAVIADALRVPAGTPYPIGYVARTGEAVFLESLGAWRARFPDVDPAALAGRDDGAWAALPLRTAGRLTGVLTLSFWTARAFSDDDRTFLVAVAHQCAIAMERARLHAEVAEARGVAERADRAKGDFLAIMSHELRTPLNAVIGHCELVLDEIFGPVNAAQRDSLARARAGAQHLSILLQDVVAYQRLATGVETVQWEPCVLDDILDGVVADVAPMLAKKGLVFTRVPPQTRLTLVTDPGKFRQVVTNVLANAVKFTGRDAEDGPGRVTLETDVEGAHAANAMGAAGGWLRLAVHDTGPGIAPEVQGRLFDGFWQLDQRYTRKVDGLGIGLSVAKQLAQLLGGDVFVARSAPGEGSTFVVRLPLHPPSGARA